MHTQNDWYLEAFGVMLENTRWNVSTVLREGDGGGFWIYRKCTFVNDHEPATGKIQRGRQIGHNEQTYGEINVSTRYVSHTGYRVWVLLFS